MNKRAIILTGGLLAILAIAAALLLPRFTGGESVSAGVVFSPSMLARVPLEAHDVILIPHFDATVYRLKRHPLGRDFLRAAAPGQPLGLIATAVGNGAVISYRSEAGSGFILKMSAVRSSFLRMFGFLLPKPWDEFYVEDGLVIVGRPGQIRSSAPALATFGTDLKGELFLYQPPGAHASFPPLATPNLSAVSLRPGAITMESRSPSEPPSPASVPRLGLLRDAMFSALVSSTPEAMKNLDRVLPVNIGPLLEHGGLMALYKVDAKKFVPKPEGIIAIPLGGGRQQEIEQLISETVGNFHFGDVSLNRQSVREHGGITVKRSQTIGMTIEYATVAGLAVLSFDKSSMDRFLDDRQETAASPDAIWSVRVDPSKAVDAIETLRGQQLSFLLGGDTGRKLERAERALRLVREARLILIEKRNVRPGPSVFTTIQAK
ncbi:MAG TPA: hypothetical protein VHL58_07955 [Thermoanaerobaculia bacterium]|nr:hypothetical protein [Thermoanaerobaculia bacterium]